MRLLSVQVIAVEGGYRVRRALSPGSRVYLIAMRDDGSAALSVDRRSRQELVADYPDAAAAVRAALVAMAVTAQLPRGYRPLGQRIGARRGRVQLHIWRRTPESWDVRAVGHDGASITLDNLTRGLWQVWRSGEWLATYDTAQEGIGSAWCALLDFVGLPVLVESAK